MLPTASNVAVALTQAQINEDQTSKDFLQQNLDDVYNYKDPRSYPLSSYSYLIVPTTAGKQPPIFNTEVGKSLSTYINFYLCQGQQQAAALGYSPLPINLVTGAFLQVNKIPGTVGAPDIHNYGTCNNPTFVNGQDILLKDAPYPSKCQKAGSPLSCTTGSAGPAATGTASPGATGQPSTAATASPGATASSAAGSGSGSSTGGHDGRRAEYRHHRLCDQRAGQRRRPHPARRDHGSRRRGGGGRAAVGGGVPAPQTRTVAGDRTDYETAGAGSAWARTAGPGCRPDRHPRRGEAAPVRHDRPLGRPRR